MAAGYFLSSDLGLRLKLQVQQLTGSVPAMAAVEPPLTYAEWLSRSAAIPAADLHVLAQLYSYGVACGLPERTFCSPGSRLRWNEWITFTAKYSDLSADAYVWLTVIGSAGPREVRKLGTAKLLLFDGHRLREGLVREPVLLSAEGGGSDNGRDKGTEPLGSSCFSVARASLASKDEEAPTGAGASDATGGVEEARRAELEAEMARLERMSAMHEQALSRGASEGGNAGGSLGWLDKPSFALLEQRQQILDAQLERHFLQVLLPEFEYAVICHERVASVPPPLVPRPAAASMPSRSSSSAAISTALPSPTSNALSTTATSTGGGSTTPGGAYAGTSVASDQASRSPSLGGGLGLSEACVLVADGELLRDSPALAKHHKLARSLLSAGFARELKPDAQERQKLAALVALPPTQRLRDEEKELIWKFRYALRSQKAALTKLLKCVDWSDAREAAHARQLADEWITPSVHDLLELLGASFVDAAPWVRQYAVDALRQRATNAQLLAYLLPLVQAIQYERHLPLPAPEAPLASLLIERAVASASGRGHSPSPTEASRQAAIGGATAGPNPFGAGVDQQQRAPAGAPQGSLRPVMADANGGFEGSAGDGITDGSHCELAVFFHWYLRVEQRDPRHGLHFRAVHDAFLYALQCSTCGDELRFILSRQEGLVASLSAAATALKASGESRPKRIARLQSMFEVGGTLSGLRAMSSPLPLPLDPNTAVTGAVPQRATVFKSALSPLGIAFTLPAPKPRPYSIIFKSGDDLRQDQLVLQMIRLMDGLLKDQGLNLRLTPYRVLATAPGEGLVERVPDCMPLAQVLAEHKNDIRRYLQKFHPNPTAPYGIEPQVLESFVKSCAGYCVAMYVMGVGDRHLDNLMLCSNGALFHIDFGYILGRDPKPFPPPMKLCKEMVEAMGGANSSEYERFRVLCCEAFNIIRASSNLILNLLMLMSDAGVQDIKNEQDVLKVAEKLRLDLSNEEAAQFFQELINDSVSALFPQITETIHRWAQYWRS